MPNDWDAGSGPIAFEWRSSSSRQPVGIIFQCDDCGRRFANKGWHAEACGSPNFHPVTENPSYGPGNPDWEHDRDCEDKP